ncbi:tyrosine-protein phosphatase [Actinospica sp. MGRD01-02]|uniref:Tyrosine-protein phosphatase n=1 Tax=Actinospica acidithermotolerans TaxID=2828514 RepID=A0A941IGM7_9ACTN|nr:tyrosine-protein phosphatase [Actinospica acidithermotolerans]MBR7826304.1 tyrosine-protein phosphatase [Actinospica acidithermotolerans]
MSIGVEVIPDPEPLSDPERIYLELVGPERALRIDGVMNARDIGGLIGERGPVRAGRLLRSARLQHLSPQGGATLTGLDLRTVIDLRTPRERVEYPNDLTGLDGVTEIRVELLETLDDVDALPGNAQRELYRYLVDTCGAGIVAVLEHLAKPDALPALVHCHVGKDRTGLTVALLLELLGVPRDVIAADYVMSNAGLGAIRHNDVQAEVLVWTLAGLDERFGGPQAYLAAHGLRDETVDALRAAFLDSSA